MTSLDANAMLQRCRLAAFELYIRDYPLADIARIFAVHESTIRRWIRKVQDAETAELQRMIREGQFKAFKGYM